MSGAPTPNIMPPLSGIFHMPDRAPDLCYPPLNDAQAWRQYSAAISAGREATRAMVWKPTHTEPGYVYAERHEGSYLSDTSAEQYYDSVHRLYMLSSKGLQPVFEAAGLQARLTQPDPGNIRHHAAELAFPGPPAFCTNVDAAADQGLTYVRYALAPSKTAFTSHELAKSLAKGRMLIANPTPEHMRNSGQAWYDFWHDLTVHAPGHLALGQVAAQRMFSRGRWAHYLRSTRLRKQLCADVEYGIYTGTIPFHAHDSHDSSLVNFDPWPRRGRETAFMSTLRHVRYLRSLMQGEVAKT